MATSRAKAAAPTLLLALGLLLLLLVVDQVEARGGAAVLGRTLRRPLQRQAAGFLLPKSGVVAGGLRYARTCDCCQIDGLGSL